MSFWSGNMSGARVRTPLLLLLLLLLLSSLTGTALCQDEEDQPVEDSSADPVEDTGDATETDPHEQTEEGDDASVASWPPTTPQTDPVSSTAGPASTDEGSGGGSGSGDGEEGSAEENTEDTGLNPIIIMVPVVLVVIIIGMIVCGIFINRRWNTKVRKSDLRKEDPYLDGSNTEKVPMPMFEEDVPSVLELEMEELDQWMKKDGETAEDSKNQ